MTAGDLTTIAQRRHSAPANLIRSIRGDLDWIVMKALEKDRSRRYETANGLAMEVQRHLANEPVLARPPSTIYKFRKLAVRNKLLFGAITVITIVLVVSLFVVTVSLGRARTEADKSGQITEFLKEMLKGVGPSAARGRDTVMLREILDRTAARIGKDMGRQPAVEAELRSLIGRLYLEIGEPRKAEKMHRAALAINRKLFGAASKEAAASLNDLGFVFWSEGHTLADAERSFQEALTIRRQIFGNTNLDVAISLNLLANVYRQQGRLDASEIATQEALQIWQKLSKSESLNAADSLLNLCILRGDRFRWVEAEELARKVLAIRRRELGDDDILVAKSLADVAWAAGANGKLAEAESLEREALALRRKLLSEQHPDVAKSLYLVGDRLRQEGKKLDEAHALLSEALSKQRKLGEEETRDMLDSMRSLGLTLEAEGKLVEAEALHREALVLWRKRHEIATPQAQWQLECLVRVLVAQEKLADAEQILDEILTPETLRNPSIIRALDLRIDLLARQGQWEKAAADAARALELQPTDQNRFHALAPLLVITHNHPGYEQLRRRVLTTFAGTTDPLVADRVAKDCLLLPCSDTELRKIDRLADMALNAGEEASRPNEYLRLSMPFFQTCKASSEYRQGRFAESVDWAQKVVESSQLYAKAQAYSILALAQWRLGHTEIARSALAEADRSIMHISGQRNDQGGWLALIFARLWLEEAYQLINSEKDQGKLPWWKRQSQYPQALSELDRHCHALIVQKKFGDAEKLLDDALTADLIGKPISADLLALRAGLKARRGRWQEASADASRSHENQPLESAIYSMVAGLLVKTDDRAGYERFCNRIFAAHGNTTNIYVADQVAKACLLIPSSEVDLEPIGRLADAVVTLGAGDEGAMPFFQICKALAEYRLGHFAEAGQWAQRSVNNSRKDTQGHAYAILAMSDWQLGRKDEARAMLAKGDALAPRDMPTSVAENPGNDWLAWLFARIQLDEAAKLIQPTSTINAASKEQ